MCWLTPQAPWLGLRQAGASSIPPRCARNWAILCCLSKPFAGNWIRSGSVGKWTAMACLQVAALPIVPQHQCPLYLIPKTSFFLIHLCLSYFFSLTMITFLFFDSFFSLEAHPLFLNGFPSDKLFLFCFPERTDTLLTLEKKFEDRDLFFLECCEKHLAVLWLLLLLLALTWFLTLQAVCLGCFPYSF